LSYIHDEKRKENDMAYSWESERIILVSVSPDNLKQGTTIPAEWQQKLVCRACRGSGCSICDQLGYLTKKKMQSVQIQGEVVNGSWLRFIGAGDERPDLGGYGDAVIQIHIVGMEEPSALTPEMGSTVDQNELNDIFSQFFGSGFAGATPCNYTTLTLTKQEAKEGCRKHITIPITSICSACEGSGLNPNDPKSTCAYCKGSGHVVDTQRLPIPVPPNTKNKTIIKLSQVGDTKVHNGAIQTSDVAVTIKVKGFFF